MAGFHLVRTYKLQEKGPKKLITKTIHIMKKTYLTPRLEVIDLGTEQSVLTISDRNIFLFSPTPSADQATIEGMSGWGSNQSWSN